MIFDRRELLRTFGVASASTLLWTLGCSHPPPPRRAPQVSGEIRAWLHDAVARLAARYPAVHALAVSRRRTVVASDTGGSGIGRERRDAVVLTVRDRDGRAREHVSTELTADGVAAAATALGANGHAARVELGPAPAMPAEAPPLDDTDLQRRVTALRQDMNPSSRIIYRAAVIDHDDAIVWSVSPARDAIQRLIRIRQSATRAAWNGTRPGLGEIERAWSGGLDSPTALTAADVEAVAAGALEPMTPGSFADGERTVVLDPSVAAALFDAVATYLLDAADITASPLVTLVDDPTAAGAYGGFSFDDEGTPAAAVTLLDAGRPTHFTGRARRAGHTAPIQPSTSHLQLLPGALPLPALYSEGLVLEGSLGASIISSTAGPQIRLPCARARELHAGTTNGKVHASIELVAPLSALLSSIDALSSAPSSFALRTADRDAPSSIDALSPSSLELWRSISIPAVRTRGFVRALRTRA